MIIDGKAIAQGILTRIKGAVSELPYPPRIVAIVASETVATQSYLKIKSRSAAEAGCMFEIHKFSETITGAELRAAVAASDASVVIVQLPLPPQIDPREVCDAIVVSKDADVLSSAAREKFARGDTNALLPPVVAAIREILVFGNIVLTGKRAIVIGDGWLVGKPAAIWLAQQGVNVEVVTEKSENLAAALLMADVIISGAGSPHFIKPDMIKTGVVLIDAGTSESGGQVAGDADPACALKCSLFTPVPGGLGPIAVACLFENALSLG